MDVPRLSEDDTGPIKLPHPSELPEHVAGLTLAARQQGRRIRGLESWGRWVIGTIAVSSASLIISIVSAAFYIGARMEALTQVATRLETLESRVSHLEDRP